MKKAAILMADGFEESEALVPYDILCRGGVDTALVSVSGNSQVTGAHDVIVADLMGMEAYSFDAADALILPGGGGGYEILRASAAVRSQIEAFSAAGKVIGAICASGALLGEMGLLSGKKYTCYPTMDGDFGGTYQRKPAVIDGTIVTGIGPGGAFPFGFALVELLAGPQKAAEVKDAACWLF